MLEGRHHQHALIVAEDVLGAVAVVHVEVDHRHALEPVLAQRMGGAHCHVVEEAEPHRTMVLGVMAWRADAAECVCCLPFHHQIGCEHHGPRSSQRRRVRMRVHGSVRIQMYHARGRRRCFDRIHVVGIVYASQLLPRGGRRIVLDQTSQHPRGDQRVRNSLETCGTLGVMPPHVVQKAVAMSDVRGLHRLEFGSGMLRALGALGYDIESSRRGISRSTP